MSGPKVASKVTGGNLAISGADRKLINTVKEVVTNHSDEEIYTMLKECNRDPNDAVQRLLNQDNFHLVKRKRGRKKELGTAEDHSDNRQASSGNYGRGGRSNATSLGRGAVGRGSQSPRNDGSGGKTKIAAVKENGVPPVKTPSVPGGTSLSYSQLVQPKTFFNDAANKNLLLPGGISNGETLQGTSSSNIEGGWSASAGYGTSTALQGAWLAGSGHGTIADMLKGGGSKATVSAGSFLNDGVLSAGAPTRLILEQMSASSTQISVSDLSGGLPYESCTQSPDNVMNREIGAEGSQLSAADLLSLGLQNGELYHYAQGSNSAALSLEREAGPHQSAEINITLPQEEHALNANVFQGRVVNLQEGNSGSLGSQFNGSSSYHGPQFVDSQKENGNDDWNSHYEEAPAVEVFSERIAQGSSSPAHISNTAAKLHELNFRDSHSVIIPDHIRVSEADCTMLSFGSFDVGFDGLSSNISVPEAESHSFSASDSTAIRDLTAAMQSLSTSIPHSTLEHEQPICVSTQNLHEDADANVIADESGGKEEEDVLEHSAQHDYTSGYSVINATSSDGTSLYTGASEDTDSRPRDASSIMTQYDNSAYYSDVFRLVPEMDSRYSAFSQQLASNGKLPTSRVAETTMQMTSLEVVNTPVYPSSNTGGFQTLSTVNNGPSPMTVPQHSMHLHPYATQPSGLPLGSFGNVVGYQYMTPRFSYVQSPYHHNYAGTSNYHQVPTALGAGAMKFPLPQYKTAGPVVGGMQSTMSPNALGYGGYPASQPTVNLPVTSVNTSNFDDASSHQYKENNMYLPGQQVDGPSVWLQSQLAREAAQGSSYYNVPSQGQPTGYSRTQSLLTHTHTAAVYSGNVYHPLQSASSPSAQQLLQQHQALSSMGALGTQIGSYQQNQRAQPTWTPGPY